MRFAVLCSVKVMAARSLYSVLLHRISTPSIAPYDFPNHRLPGGHFGHEPDSQHGAESLTGNLIGAPALRPLHRSKPPCCNGVILQGALHIRASHSRFNNALNSSQILFGALRRRASHDKVDCEIAIDLESNARVIPSVPSLLFRIAP